MKETTIKKMFGNNHGRKHGLSLNKRTIAHLTHHQMRMVNGGDNISSPCAAVVICLPGDTQNCQAETTRDTGIPPESGIGMGAD